MPNTEGDTRRTAGRPRVICHMLTSVDGRIVVEGWPLSGEGSRQYEEVHSMYEPDAWLCGRVTMEQHFAAGTRSDAEVARTYDGPPREDFVAPGAAGEHASFAIAVDARGKLVWASGEVAGDHVVAVLSERVSDEYLATLRERGVSYLLAGRDDVDLSVALEKIGDRLGVRTLMLEGGGGLNGSFLRAGLVDEVSLLVAPVADGRIGTPTLFDVAGEGATPRRLVLDGVERRADDVLWLRYRVERP
jgi:2,5-diamino-6-(ribosylamino)-4(3H)-pyrimidinone 5'-phosphate reductase